MTKSKKKKVTVIDGYWSNNPKGSLCSGYGVFPGGAKCKGCSDCGGKKVTVKQAVAAFNKNHCVITISKKNNDLRSILGKALKKKPKSLKSKNLKPKKK